MNKLDPQPIGTLMSRKYRSDKDFQKALTHWTAAGWTVKSDSARKAMMSLTTGIFTRRQIHTVLWEKVR